MKIHGIVDYSFLYYKYFFQLESGKMRRLTAPIEWNGVIMERDVSQIYYSIREIEGFRRQLEQLGHEVVLSICFDMPSERSKTVDDNGEKTEGAAKYKSNRVKRLSEEDFKNIQYVERLLSDAGYNTYRIDGFEADDIVNHLVRTEKDNFDYTIIYTPDSDLLVNIGPKVGASRYKSKYGYASVDMNNYSTYLEGEFKVAEMPYNALMLFKSTVGDNSDSIDGINKFGPKAFDRLVAHLNSLNVDWSNCGTYEGTLGLIEKCRGYLKDEQIEQAIDSLSMVRPMIFEDGVITKPTKVSTSQLREESYMRCGMKSLII